MGKYIRLVDFNNAEEKEQQFFNKENYYEVNQKDFEKIPGSPIAYWVSDRVKEIFEKSEKLGDLIEIGSLHKTADNEKYLKLKWELDNEKIGLNKKWVIYSKGGQFRRWFGNNEIVINWSQKAINFYKKNKTSNLLNKKYWFKKGIGYSDISTYKISMRSYLNQISDMKGPVYYVNEENYNYLLGFTNTKFTEFLAKLLNPTMSFQIGDLKKLPILFPENYLQKIKINKNVEFCINLSKEEWDSRETSWDFESLGILNGSSLEEGMNNYCSEWKEKFYQMHKNEEELNRIFIDIYELQDEMDEFVDINDITLLKNELLKESKKLVLDENNEIIFNKEELIKQFLSYAVGCIMGRYSLDKKGLIIANSDDNLVINENSFEIKDSEGERRHKIENSKFIPDEYGIIPITNTKIFENDIVDMIIKFLEASFGEENLEENLKFIGDVLNKNGNSPREAIRNYFIKDFYTDHLKRYKRRPIYWMLSSGKTNSFQALVYMHRYEENTVGRIRTDYLNRYQEFIEMQKKYFENQSENEELSSKERKNADKELKKISTEEKELTIYANNVKHIAEKRISIDLDDGVKVNYGKFKEILKKI